MITIPRTLRVWGHRAPVDLRKRYNGLVGIVRQLWAVTSWTATCSCSVNRKRTTCKVLMWDGTGLCIFMKRLERGRFADLSGQGEDRAVRLSTSELALFIEGCALVGKYALSPIAIERKRLVSDRGV